MFIRFGTLFLALLFIASSVDAQNRRGTLQNEEVMADLSFDVNVGGDLEVKVGDADVFVHTGSNDVVRVKITLSGRDLNRARDYYERQHFEIGEAGNTVYVEDDPEENLWRMFQNDGRNHPQIVVEVTTPEAFNVRLRTSDGDLVLDRLEGDIHASTSDGDIHAERLVGPVVLRTSDGDIEAASVRGVSLEAHTSDGDLRFGDVAAQTIEMETSDGDIRARSLDGSVTLKTSDGDIEIGDMQGPSLTARTSDGDIHFDQLICSDGEIRTSDGSIVLDHFEGNLDASGGDGNVYVSLYKPGNVSLQTGDGDIEIVTPTSFPLDVYLRGDLVSIDRAFDFSGHIDEDNERAEGRISGGGPSLAARTSDGSVRLRIR